MSEDTGQYDDRVDTDAVISSASALGLMLRAVRLLTQVKGLFAAKALLALAAIFPPLTVPWFTKIIVDQVILDQPFNATEVRFPRLCYRSSTLSTVWPRWALCYRLSRRTLGCCCCSEPVAKRQPCGSQAGKMPPPNPR